MKCQLWGSEVSNNDMRRRSLEGLDYLWSEQVTIWVNGQPSFDRRDQGSANYSAQRMRRRVL